MADRRADARDRRVVQWTLRAGLVTAVALLITGMAVDLAQGNRDAPPIRLFEIFSAPHAGERLMALGVLVLGMTPAFRVLVLLGLWARERDHRFVAVAATVVVLLALAALVGG